MSLASQVKIYTKCLNSARIEPESLLLRCKQFCKEVNVLLQQVYSALLACVSKDQTTVPLILRFEYLINCGQYHVFLQKYGADDGLLDYQKKRGDK